MLVLCRRLRAWNRVDKYILQSCSSWTCQLSLQLEIRNMIAFFEVRQIPPCDTIKYCYVVSQMHRQRFHLNPSQGQRVN